MSNCKKCCFGECTFGGYLRTPCHDGEAYWIKGSGEDHYICVREFFFGWFKFKVAEAKNGVRLRLKGMNIF